MINRHVLSGRHASSFDPENCELFINVSYVRFMKSVLCPLYQSKYRIIFSLDQLLLKYLSSQAFDAQLDILFSFALDLAILFLFEALIL